MSTKPFNSLEYVNQCCPTSLKDFICNDTWVIPMIGVAIAIAGVATMIFAQNLGGAIGYALFGLTIIYHHCFREDKAISNLTSQIENSDEILQQKHGEIANLTKKLETLEKTSELSNRQLTQNIAKLQDFKIRFEKNIQGLQEEKHLLIQQNQTLTETNDHLSSQIAGLMQASSTLERRIQNFGDHAKELTPQIDRLSNTSQQLEGSGRTFLQGIQSLEAFSKQYLSLKNDAETLREQNALLLVQLTQLQEARHNTGALVESAKQFHLSNESSIQELGRLTALKAELLALEAKIASDTKTLLDLVVKIP